MDQTETNEVFEKLVSLAQEAGVLLGTAESVTGGQLAHHITRQPGAGDVFAGGVVAYQTDVKQTMLDVPEGPVVSHAAAEAMAVGARRLLGCDLVVSITGVAGPEPQDGQPVGCVFIGEVFGEEPATSSRYSFDGDPDAIRQSATMAAAQTVLERLSRLTAVRPGSQDQ
jgi:PncC family amidohydrolase